MNDATTAFLDAYAAPRRLVKVGRRRRINLHVTGSGPATVVLSAGLAGGTLDWARVQPFAFRFATVVSHDIAGIGFSDPGPLPRTSGAIVEDLRAALKAAGLAPPYVLVGHSAGGLNSQLWAFRYPQEVAAMVLVDAVTAHFERRVYGGPAKILVEEQATWRRMLAMARAGTLTADTPEWRQYVATPKPGLTPAVNAMLETMWRTPGYLRAIISESREVGRKSSAEIDAVKRPLGDIPLIVLSAGRIGQSHITGGDPARIAAWYAMHDDMAALSTRGERRTLDGGHNLPIDCPRDVVAAIEEVVAAVIPPGRP